MPHQDHQAGSIGADAPIHPPPQLTFQTLPDVVHTRIASFLPLWDLLRTPLGARWLRTTYRTQVTKLCLRYDYGGYKASLSSLLDDLVGLKEVIIDDGDVMKALEEALQRPGQEPRGKDIELLRVQGEWWTEQMERLARMMEARRLPVLKVASFRLDGSHSWTKTSMVAVCRALGGGACPALEALEMEFPTEDDVTALAEAVTAVAGRADHVTNSMCLRRLGLRANGGESLGDGVGVLLQKCGIGMRERVGLEELSLVCDMPKTSVRALANYLMADGCRIRRLHLSCRSAIDPVVEALGQGKAARGLRSLYLARAEVSTGAVMSLLHAIEGGAWLELEELEMHDLVLCHHHPEGAGCISALVRAIGNRCTRLRNLRMYAGQADLAHHYCGALASAIRDGRFVAMQSLGVVQSFRGRGQQQHVSEVITRALAVTPSLLRLTTLDMESCEVSATAMAALVEAMQVGACRWLQHLDLSLASIDTKALNVLPTAMEEGQVGLELRRIDYPCTLALTGALLHGACPKLEKLKAYLGQGQSMSQCIKHLVGIIGGQAPCSSSLKELKVYGGNPCAGPVNELVDAMQQPGGVRLERLDIECVSREMMEGLVEALMGRAGSRLRRLVLGGAVDVMQESMVAVVQGIRRGMCPELAMIALFLDDEAEEMQDHLNSILRERNREGIRAM